MYLWLIGNSNGVRSLRANAIGQLVQKSEGDEQALYVLLGATGMRISEALAVQIMHFVNDDAPSKSGSKLTTIGRAS